MSEQQQPYLVNTPAAAGTVEEYQFEPIKGYPMLQWRGKRPFRSTRFYPAQLREVHGPEVEGWRNKIYWGDNLQVMSHLLKRYRGQVQLVYIDPPFDSKADYRLKLALRQVGTEGNYSSFEEKQYSDIWTNDTYLQFMYERLVLLRELLCPTGTLWLHCDWHQNYRLRAILDEVFGSSGFINEVAWQRTFSRAASKTINNIHDTVYVYSSSSTPLWNRVLVPASQEYIDSRFTMEETDGRRFQGVALTAPGISKGETGGEWRGFNPSSQGRHWAYRIETLNHLDMTGRIYWPSAGGWPRLKRYADEVKGVALQSIWTDISPVNSQASEDTGFPTQKPIPLLERILRIASNPGDLVFDCFMGSGTTQAVAMKLGRRFIGADINLGAVQITTRRLLQVGEDLKTTLAAHQQPKQQPIAYQPDPTLDDAEDEEDAAPPADPTVFYTGFEVYNVNHYDIFRNPVQAKDLLLQALEVQPVTAGSVFDGTKDGRMVKIMPVNRIATRADLNDLLANLDLRAFERLHRDNPNRIVERITLVCMGHEPDLAASLKQELHPYHVDVEVVDVLRDRQDLQFKRDSEAKVVVKGGWLEIAAFYPMNLLQKLSMQKEAVSDWRELVESVMIDWNYDGAVLTPALTDIPDKNELVVGRYQVPESAGTIRVKITDLLSESWEGNLTHA